MGVAHVQTKAQVAKVAKASSCDCLPPYVTKALSPSAWLCRRSSNEATAFAVAHANRPPHRMRQACSARCLINEPTGSRKPASDQTSARQPPKRRALPCSVVQPIQTFWEGQKSGKGVFFTQQQQARRPKCGGEGEEPRTRPRVWERGGEGERRIVFPVEILWDTGKFCLNWL